MTTDPLLVVDDLRVAFTSDGGVSEAVSGIGFTLARGASLCLVGESGCGKSVTALAILGLLPTPPARVDARAIRFEGRDLLAARAPELRAIRGRRIGMIFQEPMTSLNPTMTVGEQIAEVLTEHEGADRATAKRRTIELLERVRIPHARQRFDEYPHRLSGGMRQRAMIAMALACSPALLIADEPTTALDVTIQAEILDLLRELRRELDMALLLITHDLGVVAEIADDVAVMYAGRIVEHCRVAELFARPQHPYTIGLLGALPTAESAGRRLTPIDGTVPLGHAMPGGCRFHPRCPFAEARCGVAAPAPHAFSATHAASCWRAPLDELAA